MPRLARCCGTSGQSPDPESLVTKPGRTMAPMPTCGSKGGGGIWHIGNVDPELGLVYFVTGNAVPMFGGEARKGDNLYTASILAHDIRTGELRWYYQVVHHDLWDADIAIAPMLYNAEIDGQPRKGLAALRADGYIFMLDRETGEPLFPIEERPVSQDAFNHTSPTQPFPVGADPIVPTCDAWRDKVPAPWVLDCSGFAPLYVDRDNVVAAGVPIPRVRVTAMSYSPDRCHTAPIPDTSTRRVWVISVGRVESATTRGSEAARRGIPRCRPRLASSGRLTAGPTSSCGSTRSKPGSSGRVLR